MRPVCSSKRNSMRQEFAEKSSSSISDFTGLDHSPARVLGRARAHWAHLRFREQLPTSWSRELENGSCFVVWLIDISLAGPLIETGPARKIVAAIAFNESAELLLTGRVMALVCGKRLRRARGAAAERDINNVRGGRSSRSRRHRIRAAGRN